MDMSKSSTYQYFPDLSAWITEFLSKHMDMTASETGNNMLVKQV